jgi:hypothetical protein
MTDLVHPWKGILGRWPLIQFQRTYRFFIGGNKRARLHGRNKKNKGTGHAAGVTEEWEWHHPSCYLTFIL